MTDIFVYCPICNKENGKMTKCDKVAIIMGASACKLSCGHIIDSDGLINMELSFWFDGI
jgi:hypothetical protein